MGQVCLVSTGQCIKANRKRCIDVFNVFISVGYACVRSLIITSACHVSADVIFATIKWL